MNENTIVLDVIEDANGLHRALLPEARFGMDGPVPDRKARITQAPFPREQEQGYRWAPWGELDCLPTDIRKKLYKSSIGPRAISQKVKMLYGNGLCYYRNSDLADGNTTIQRAYEPKIEAWLKRNRVALKWYAAQAADYSLYMNSFSEMVMNKRRDFITGIYHKPAEFCRLSRQDERNYRINWLYYSPDFSEGFPPADERIKQVPLFNWWDEDRFFDTMSGYKFAYHSRFETPGITYYARPWWLGLFRKNGWIDVSISVPEIVNSMMKNQIMLKYQILIPETYFEVRHRDWQTYTDEKREEVIDGLIKKINKELADTENAFKSITTLFKQDEVTSADIGKLEIIAIDDKIKKDSWVPSSNIADAQIVQGLELHPSQVGLAPEGGKMGAGSGSDQRESFNTGITLNTLDQDVILEPLNFIAKFNTEKGNDSAWDVTFFIDHTFHTTTNNQETGLSPSGTTLQVE